jgi:uncharacterized protein
MPLIKSSYTAPGIFRNYHVSTIYSATMRKINVPQERERLELPDSDFLDIDWSFAKKPNSKQVLIIMHGLEGSANRPYVTGLAKYFTEHDWDVAAINFRGCSGEMNRKYRSYHAGATEDLHRAVDHILEKKKYDTVALNGFSLGGNLMLKYLGEGKVIPKEVRAAVMVSVPCDLHGSLQQLDKKRNFLYSRRFIKKLKHHLLLRASIFPEQLTPAEVRACSSLKDIDDLYTSRAHDFDDALDYYKKNSSLNFLGNIGIPTLLINALNDGFLSESCYPTELARKSKFLYLETPLHGGHVGFVQNKPQSYTEERALEFLNRRR